MIFEHRIHSNINHHEEEQATSYLFSLFEYLWSSTATTIKKKNKTKQITKSKGLQPRTAITIAQVHTVTEPITINYRNNDDDDYDYLSKSDSTSSSFGSSISSSSTSSYNDDTIRSRRRRQSLIALSEILCEHYVQLHSTIEKQEEDHEVPLETFKTFKTLDEDNILTDDESYWFMGNTNPKQWVLVDELLRQQTETTDDDNNNNNNQKESSVIEVKKPVTRGIRTNSDHLRMIVAEVNMMRANKIICPLRPRGFLPARIDTFIPNSPSPLSASSFI